MARVPHYRWLIPIGHAVVDVVLLAAWISHAVGMVRYSNRGALPRSSGTTAVLYQEGGEVSWDPRTLPPPEGFMLLAFGTMPAGVVSLELRPQAWWPTRGHLWDPIWFSIHEPLAILFWFVIGQRLDTGRSRLTRSLTLHLLARYIIAVCYIAGGFAAVSNRLQVLFWLALAVYGLAVAVQWIRRRMPRFRRGG